MCKYISRRMLNHVYVCSYFLQKSSIISGSFAEKDLYVYILMLNHVYVYTTQDVESCVCVYHTGCWIMCVCVSFSWPYRLQRAATRHTHIRFVYVRVCSLRCRDVFLNVCSLYSCMFVPWSILTCVFPEMDSQFTNPSQGTHVCVLWDAFISSMT